MTPELPFSYDILYFCVVSIFCFCLTSNLSFEELSEIPWTRLFFRGISFLWPSKAGKVESEEAWSPGLANYSFLPLLHRDPT